MRSEGCKECGLEICRNVRRKTKEEVQKDLDEKFNFKYELIGEYKGNKVETQFRCRDCGYEFTARTNDVLSGRRVCKKCYLNRNKSNLEEIIDNLLKNNNIEYIFQCSNKNLNFLGRQTLDFYLPKYKIAIECQGIQHFQTVEHFGGEKRLKRTMELDKEKKIICENNGIEILYFSNLNIDYPYDVIEDENIIINYILSK